MYENKRLNDQFHFPTSQEALKDKN